MFFDDAPTYTTTRTAVLTRFPKAQVVINLPIINLPNTFLDIVYTIYSSLEHSGFVRSSSG